MRITMICIGSTGDVHPYIVLGRELKARGHEISICAFAPFEKTVEKEGMRFRPISGDVHAFMASLMKPGAMGVGFLKQVRDTLKQIIDPLLNDLEAACEGAEAVIATYFGQIIPSIVEKRHIPYIQTQFFMMDNNPYAPISSAPGQYAGKAWNLASYQIGYLLISTMERYYLSDWRKERGMPPRKLESKPMYEMNGHTVPVMYAMSPIVVPRPTTWAENIHMTGFWLDDEPSVFTPPPELRSFLEAGEPPIYIGFGSMTGNDIEAVLQIVLRSLEQTGMRAIVAKGWGGMEVPKRPNLFAVDYVPHDWLFRQVSAVVHHGGAGTTAAGILAGKPTLVIPFGGDQPFWGKRVHALGIGPRPILREWLTVPKLTKALVQLKNTKSYSVAARELGIRLHLENGAVIAANLIEHELRKWLREEGLPPVLFDKSQEEK